MPFLDAFAAGPDHPDYAAHLKVDDYLRDCEANRHSPRSLFAQPKILQPEGHDSLPALTEAIFERVEWNVRNRQAHFVEDLSHLAERAIGWATKSIGEAALLRLVRFGSQLHSNGHGQGRFYNLPTTLERLLENRRVPLTAELRRALPGLVDYLVRIHSHSPSTFAIGWHLFLDEAMGPVGGCFSDRVKTDWLAMPAAQRAAWREVFLLADHNWQSGGQIRESKKLVKALRNAGLEQVVARIGSWIPDPKRNPAELSGVGMTLLRQMLIWATVLPDLEADQTLYQLAEVEWAEPNAELLNKEWIGTLLQCLAVRDPNKSFACAERLANNPQLGRFSAVRSFYTQRLAEIAHSSDATYQGRKEGVDGYCLDAVPGEAALQHILDQVLEACVPRNLEAIRKSRQMMDQYMSGELALPGPEAFDDGGGLALDDDMLNNAPVYDSFVDGIEVVRGTSRTAAIRRANGDLLGLLRAMNRRTQYLASKWPRRGSTSVDEGDTPWLYWRCEMGYLYHEVLQLEPQGLEITDLVALCQVDRLHFLGIAPSSPIYKVCKARIAQRGFEPELTRELHLWVKSLHGSNAAMTLRKHAEWMLWFDPNSPVEEKHCWSARVRKDVCAMSGPVQEAWIELLGNHAMGNGVKPTKIWSKKASALYKRVGQKEFRKRFMDWFAPFRGGATPGRLTTTGRGVLRNLLWYALIAQDPDVDQAIAWFGQAQWKTKQDRGRTLGALPAWVHAVIERLPNEAAGILERYHASAPDDCKLMGKSYEMYREHCDGHKRPQAIEKPAAPKPPDLAAMRQKLMSSMVTGFGGRIEGDRILVKGKKDSYIIHIADSRIVRESDGKLLRIEAGLSEKFPIFAPVQMMMDQQDLQDPFAPNWMRLGVCTYTLANDASPMFADRIVPEED